MASDARASPPARRVAPPSPGALACLLALIVGAWACSSSSGGGRTCFRDDECSEGRVCNAQGRCVEGVRPPVDGGALDGGSLDGGADAGPAIDGGPADAGPPDAGGCTRDAECGAPANICISSRCVAGCATTGCGSGRACDPATGRCGSCMNDRECGAPDAVCDNGACVPGCGVVGCAQRNATCNAGSGRCSGCASDVECSPPSTICDEGGCIPGCLSAGCSGGGSCNASTGRCGTAPVDGGGGMVGNGQLGADCQTDGDCQTGKCLELSVAGRPYKVCTRLCCTENDCPPRDSGNNGVGCIEFYGASFCLTDRIFSGTGVKLERSTGQACGPGASDNWCRSGLCRQNQQGQRTCQSTCCADADCGAFTCAFRPGFSPGEVAHHVCELNLTGGRTNDPCSSELECAAYMCIPLGSQPFCTDTCCSARDCPSGWMCMQIESGQPRYSNLGMGCIPSLGGTAGAGSPCTPGAFPNECASGVCASGTCRDTCCFDSQCPVGTFCRAVDNGEPLSGQTRTGLVRVCL